MNGAKRRQLPTGWHSSTLGDVCEPSQYGWTTSAAKNGSIPLLRTTDIGSGNVDWAKVPFCDQAPDDIPKYLLRDGDLLISRAGSVGKSYLVTSPPRSVFASYLIRFRSLIHPKFVYYFLQTSDYWKQISDHTAGIATPNVNASKLAQFQLAVAPLPEQSRIADALDELFSDLDAGLAALERVREKLKLYRASVLKAAVEGTLTGDWRAQHPHAEPATELLRRILTERRRRWGEDQLARFKAKGLEPPKYWKMKYKEPAAPDTTQLPPLPEGWCWATFEQAAMRVTVGHVGPMKDEYVDSGVPFLRSQNVRENRFEPEGLLFISPGFHARLSKSAIRPGDIAVVRSGSVGVSCVIPDTLPEANCADLVLIQRPVALLPQYGAYYLNSAAKGEVRRGRTGIALPHFNTKSVAALLVAIPPMEEQEAIVEAVEDQLSVIEHLEADLDSKLKSAQALRQSILRHAFSGQLVLQDPNDEPASELLKRIAVEHEARAREAIAAKRTTKQTNGPRTGRRGRSKKNN